MRYMAIIETDDFEDFEFFEDGIGKYMVGKDAGAAAIGGWIPLYFKECEKEPDKIRTDTSSADGAREDFVHDVYNTLDFLPTNDEANRIIDSFDRVTSGIESEDVLDKIRKYVKDWQTDIHDNEQDAETYDFVFDRIYEIIDECKAERGDK